MNEEDFKQYLDSIVDTKEFKELDDFLKISEYEGETWLEKIKIYLGYHHARTDVREFFVPDYMHFLKFFESYKSKELKMVYRPNGFIDLSETPYLAQAPMHAKSMGHYTEAYYIFADGSVYISKYPLYYKSGSKITDTACIYNAIIGNAIAKHIGIETSENFLGRTNKKQIRVLSKNFLKENEELITFFGEDDQESISKVFSRLDKELTLRKFTKEEIESKKLEFLNQELLAKLIGLKDQSPSNTGLVLRTDGNGKRYIKMAPVFDYDYSFHTAKDTNMLVRKTDDGKEDIGSLILQYRDYPGFIDFVSESIESFAMEDVYKEIYEDKGIKIFENPNESETLNNFTNFVEENVMQAKETLRMVQKDEREEI